MPPKEIWCAVSLYPNPKNISDFTLFWQPRKAVCSRDAKLKDIGVNTSGTVFEIGPNDDSPNHARARNLKPNIVLYGRQPPPVKPETVDDMPPGMGGWAEWTDANYRVEEIQYQREQGSDYDPNEEREGKGGRGGKGGKGDDDDYGSRGGKGGRGGRNDRGDGKGGRRPTGNPLEDAYDSY